jgi:hypothetical protein
MKMIIYISREGGEFLPTDIRSLETLHMYLSTLMTLTHAPYAKPRISLRDSRPGTGLQYILADLGRLSIACEAAQLDPLIERRRLAPLEWDHMDD